MSEQQDFRNRFKIVKVETTEPLKRGRWTCFDFVDKLAPKDKPPPPPAESEKSAKSTPATVQRSASYKPTSSVRPTLTTAAAAAVTTTMAAGASIDPNTAGGRPTVESQVSAPVSGATSEERELDGAGGAVPNNIPYRQSSSVPPEALRTTPVAAPAAGGAYAASAGASYNQPPHSISLPPTQPNMTTLNQEKIWTVFFSAVARFSFFFYYNNCNDKSVTNIYIYDRL